MNVEVEKRSLTSVMLQVLHEHDMGGIHDSWVDKTTKGHRIKLVGAKLIHGEDLVDFENNVRDAFGEHFIRMKVDGGVPGQKKTNYRIFLEGVKGKYWLK